MRGRWSLVMAVILCGWSGLAWPATDSQTALDGFMQGLQTWRAEFTQSITDARGRTQAPLQGQLWIERPGRFRWQLGAPRATQIMVADGTNLWFYDRDLEQVTVRRASDSMTVTPASLLAGSVPLREGFIVDALPRRAGLDWVQVTPRHDDAEFREARLGFAGEQLRRMELVDKLGQKVTLDFTRSERNQPLQADLLRFVVPAGADLIGTPAGP